jgi:MHS family proline/betaine transporter-like MFS transporter
VLAGVSLVSALVALGAGSGALLVLEHFPVQARASGLALSYAIGVALFGGTAQFVVTALVKCTGNPMSVAWYVAPACLVSFVAVMMFRERLRGSERA